VSDIVFYNGFGVLMFDFFNNTWFLQILFKYLDFLLRQLLNFFFFFYNFMYFFSSPAFYWTAMNFSSLVRVVQALPVYSNALLHDKNFTFTHDFSCFFTCHSYNYKGGRSRRYTRYVDYHFTVY
jgi:hypothetical protein